MCRDVRFDPANRQVGGMPRTYGADVQKAGTDRRRDWRRRLTAHLIDAQLLMQGRFIGDEDKRRIGG